MGEFGESAASAETSEADEGKLEVEVEVDDEGKAVDVVDKSGSVKSALKSSKEKYASASAAASEVNVMGEDKIGSECCEANC